MRPERQLEQLVPGAGAAHPVHGAEARRSEPMLPADFRAPVPSAVPPQPRYQVAQSGLFGHSRESGPLELSLAKYEASR